MFFAGDEGVHVKFPTVSTRGKPDRGDDVEASGTSSKDCLLRESTGGHLRTEIYLPNGRWGLLHSTRTSFRGMKFGMILATKANGARLTGMFRYYQVYVP